MLYKIPGGAHTIQTKPHDIIFNHKQMAELEKYNRITSNNGRGRIIGSFASGTMSKIDILENNIKDIWDYDDFKKILAKITEIKSGQNIIIDQNDGLLNSMTNNKYSKNDFIGIDEYVYTPLPDTHPLMQMQKKFNTFLEKVGGVNTLSSDIMLSYNRQMENMAKQFTTSNQTTNNKPSVTIGDIHVTCPGVTSQQVAKQLGDVIGNELNRQFSGFYNYADQISRIR